MPAFTQSSNHSSASSSSSSNSSHRRTVSTPAALSTARGHVRSPSAWLSSFFKPTDNAQPAQPAPPPPPPKDASSRPTQRHSLPPPPRTPADTVSQLPSDVHATQADKENEKPLPRVRALSPIVEESPSFRRPSEQSSFGSFSLNRDLQHRLASWDWSSSGGTETIKYDDELGARWSAYRDGEDGGEEVYRGAGEDERGQRTSDSPLHLAHDQPMFQLSAPESPPLSTNTALETVQPDASYLAVAALCSASTSPSTVDFANPFSASPPIRDVPSALLPSRPPSSLSIVPEHPGRVLPPLTIAAPFPRQDSTISQSVYSNAASDDEDDLETAGPEPRSYFSPITPASRSPDLSALAISSASSPSHPPIPAVSTTLSGESSPVVSNPSPHLFRPSQVRHVSASSQSTATSVRPSPLFDEGIFTAPGSSSTAATSCFEPQPSLPSPGAGEAVASCTSSPVVEARPTLSPASSSSSTSAEQGIWRHDWHLRARMSRYIPRDIFDALDFSEVAPNHVDDEERALSRDEELRRIEEYCRRELERRKQERHRRYLVEREMLYGEKAEGDVIYGAAV
ncbi:hypothetical protein JCM10207_009056 [Rhodosporidiobolus poonsookiae]